MSRFDLILSLIVKGSQGLNMVGFRQSLLTCILRRCNSQPDSNLLSVPVIPRVIRAGQTVTDKQWLPMTHLLHYYWLRGTLTQHSLVCTRQIHLPLFVWGIILANETRCDMQMQYRLVCSKGRWPFTESKSNFTSVVQQIFWWRLRSFSTLSILRAPCDISWMIP